MSNLKHKYKELKRLQNKIMEKDNFVNDINYKIDDFLIEANNSIENELNRLYEKVQQEEIENKERFNNLFGGLI